MTNATASAKKFSSLNVGDKFFTHKSPGRGGMKGVISWEVLTKASLSKATVTEAHGAYYRTGGIMAMHSSNMVFPC